ncbi:MAG: CpsB/CapC family capsule biosynthesis tyrosine phosphatase [Dehalococcoidia bacterium]|nr:CpsB/CapC family capsule biosynthesis tyrosine phosphatase [Dehalococcoidia bacterium]
MIDIHSHILYGVDDGAQSLEDSLEMARVAAADGIHTIVATPHGIEWSTDCNWPETVGRVKSLQDELNRLSIELKIAPGLEVYLTPGLAKQIDEGSAFPLNGSRYILVEMPMNLFPIYAEQAIFELQLKGLIPILAHPERNAGIQKDYRLLQKLVDRGVLGQVTAASLCGSFGSRTKETARVLLQRNLVHIIASDAHSPQGHRAPILSAGLAEAASLVGVERANAMVTAIPEAILADRDIIVEPPVELKPRTWSFWRK